MEKQSKSKSKSNSAIRRKLMEAAQQIDSPRTSGIAAIGEWFVKRGILYLLTQTPMFALYAGYFFRWMPYATATAFSVLLAFAVLPIWVIVRKNRSPDPDEPVHHLSRYALYALVP